MIQDCPKCGLVNPPEARRCDCGYDFVLRSVESSYLGKREPTDSPTGAETLLCFVVPGLGFLMGMAARRQGRKRAGNRLMLASALMVLVPLGIGAAFVGCR